MKKTILFSSVMLVAISMFSIAPKKASLKEAITANSIEKAKAAFDAGADPNEKWSGAPAISWAVRQSNCEMIKLLAEKGAKVDETGLLGLTALYIAVDDPKEPADMIKTNEETNARILKHYTEPEAKAKGWWAEIDPTKFSTSAEKVKLLLELGADPNYAEGNGTVKIGTPFLRAVEKQNLILVKTLLDSKKVNPELRFNAWAEKASATANYINAGVYVDKGSAQYWATVPQFNTPLLEVIEKQNFELVKLLVDGGASLTNGKKVGGYNGHTWAYLNPLDVASDLKSTEIITFLKSKGAIRVQGN